MNRIDFYSCVKRDAFAGISTNQKVNHRISAGALFAAHGPFRILVVETSTVPDYSLLFSRNIMSEEKLVEGVRGLVCLWDCKAKSYKDQTTRENAWKEVAALVS